MNNNDNSKIGTKRGFKIKEEEVNSPLLTFWPPGPPLLAKLTVTCSELKI